MTCTCGDVMEVEAASREEAVSKLKEQMTAESVAAHAAEKHPGQPVMSVEETHAMIESSVKEVV
ncbi:MAG: hypothetical protein HY506_00165 [Candidatus Yanofskybacteria bacterium]|nr:hypothetical protein [Candidatus Yanofskybacteria bacterium]